MREDFDFCGTFSRKQLVLSIARTTAQALVLRESNNVPANYQKHLSSPPSSQYSSSSLEGKKRRLIPSR